MACCHDHDHREGADAIPIVLCLANKHGTRLYWGTGDPTEDPAFEAHRPMVGDMLIYPNPEGQSLSLHRYTGTGWEPRLNAADGPDGPRQLRSAVRPVDGSQPAPATDDDNDSHLTRRSRVRIPPPLRTPS
jgi:hypothetical protein